MVLRPLAVWPESKKLQIALSSSDGAKNLYTFPIVKYEFTIPFNEETNVCINYQGLMTLIDKGLFCESLSMTTKLLMGKHCIGSATQASKINPHSLEIWSLRFQIMMILKLYTQLLEELAPFGELDAPDLYYQFHSEYSGTGSMAPYSLRLIHAEALSFSITTQYQSIARIQKLEHNTQKSLEFFFASYENANSHDCYTSWKERLHSVKAMKGRVLYRLKEYEKAFETFENLIKNEEDMRWRSLHLCNLLRLSMQLGDKLRVEHCIGELHAVCAENNFEYFRTHRIYKHILDGNYSQALEILRTTRIKSQLFPQQRECNNEAVYLLYLGEAAESFSLLRSNSGQVDEPVALNIGTVADLIATDSQEIKQTYLPKQLTERWE